MPRVKGGTSTRKRHKKVLAEVKGFRGSRSKLYRRASEARLKAMASAFKDRRIKKREFRRLWISRINAAARAEGTTYSRLISGLKAAGVEVNRKMLAEMAVNDKEGFKNLVEMAKTAC